MDYTRISGEEQYILKVNEPQAPTIFDLNYGRGVHGTSQDGNPE